MLKISNILFVAILVWSVLMTPSCSLQNPEKNVVYPSCAHRPNNPRINIRTTAENFGTIPPCRGQFVIYINKNSNVRSLNLSMTYFNSDNELLSEENIRVKLEASQNGMYQKEVNLIQISDEKCWNILISIQAMTCFLDDGTVVDCPEIRIIPPEVFHSILIDDNSLTVCRAD